MNTEKHKSTAELTNLNYNRVKTLTFKKNNKLKRIFSLQTLLSLYSNITKETETHHPSCTKGKKNKLQNHRTTSFMR